MGIELIIQEIVESKIVWLKLSRPGQCRSILKYLKGAIRSIVPGWVQPQKCSWGGLCSLRRRMKSRTAADVIWLIKLLFICIYNNYYWSSVLSLIEPDLAHKVPQIIRVFILVDAVGFVLLLGGGLAKREWVLGWKEYIERQFQHIIDHAGQQFSEPIWALFQTRVRVHLYQPDLKILVNEEVEAEELEAKLPVLRVQFLTNTLHRHFYYLLHPPHQLISEVNLRMLLLQEFLKPCKWDYVPILELPVISSEPLDCVISQMNERLLQAFLTHCEIRTCCSDVPFSVKIHLHVPAHHDPHSHVKFPTIYQQRPFYVLLNHKMRAFYYLFIRGFCCRFSGSLFMRQIKFHPTVDFQKQFLERFQRIENIYAPASVKIRYF